MMQFDRDETAGFPATAGAADPDIDHPAGIRAADQPAASLSTVAIIDRRALGRETLMQALKSAKCQFRARAFVDIGEWERSPDREDTSVILLGSGAAGHDRPPPGDELRALVADHPGIPVVVMGESEDPRHIAGILGQGAHGYIPTSVSLSVAIGALGFALAGGVFVPACALQNAGLERPEPEQSVHGRLGLSERQAAVADAVALGKPNKIIAYELDLCESTVKVHLRTIMKKLQARNRTEVAFKLHAARTRAA